MQVRLTTYSDLVRHVLDFLGANSTQEARRDARRAILSAYRDLASASRWSYYYQRGRLTLVAPYQTGTVTYLHSSGTYARQLTLSGGTWPAWADKGTVQISNVLYQVASYPESNVLTLSSSSNPGQDISTASSYTLWRDTYPLPTDCLAIDRLILVNHAWPLLYEHPDVWLERQRIYRGPSSPRMYTVRGDPHYLGSMAVSFFPAPDNDYNVDFLYQRRPRPLLIEDSSTGTVTVTAGSSTATGTGTNWVSSMVGSVLRLSADKANLPDALWGSYPAAQERVITSVSSTTSLTVDALFTQALTNVLHRVSDPADVEEAAMLTALLRGCEHEVAISRNRKDRAEIAQAYRQALILAREADSRSFALEATGGHPAYPYRLADMPLGPDVS